MKLIPSDIGRSLKQSPLIWPDENKVKDMKQRINILIYNKEKKVHPKQGQRRLIRILPYRTVENVIGGPVITLWT